MTDQQIKQLLNVWKQAQVVECLTEDCIPDDENRQFAVEQANQLIAGIEKIVELEVADKTRFDYLFNSYIYGIENS